MKLFWKYSLALAGSTAALLGVTTLVDYSIGLREAKNSIQAVQHARIETARAKISAEFSRVDLQLAEVASLPWMQSDSELVEKRDELLRFLKLQTNVTEVAIFEPKNKQRLRVSRIDSSDSKWIATREFAWIRLGQPERTQYGAVTQTMTGPIASLAVCGKNEFSPCLAAKLDMRTISNYVRGEKFGESGTVFLADNKGLVIAHSDSRYALRPTNFVAPQGKTDADQNLIEERKSFSGEDVLVTAAKLSPQDWWIVVEQSRSEALRPAQAALVRNLSVLVLGVMGAFALAFWIARRLTTPIEALGQAATAFSRGEWKQRAQLKGNDELARLANNFNGMAKDLESLYSNLEQKVKEKTAQLETEFVRREAQTKEITKLEERSRIMRDFHDGVGGHLVGLIGVARKENVSAQQIEQLVTDALVDFRIAIDSLAPEETDLLTALANLRFRLQTRLEHSGFASEWKFDGLPDDIVLPREVIFHIQRIVAEAVTNVLKHAKATKLTVAASVDVASQCIVVTVDDDGQGMRARVDADATRPIQGRGLSNIEHRCAQIGGAAKWSTGPGGSGTRLFVSVPLLPKQERLTAA